MGLINENDVKGLINDSIKAVVRGLEWGENLLSMVSSLTSPNYKIKLLSTNQKENYARLLLIRTLLEDVETDKIETDLNFKGRIRIQPSSLNVYSIRLENLGEKEATFSVYKAKFPKGIGEEYKEELIDKFTLQLGKSYLLRQKF